jgi:pre-mRNA-processing factor 6
MSGVGPKSAKTYGTAAPAYYVAGAGRGAQGFTTRSDIGPARPTAPPGAEGGGMPAPTPGSGMQPPPGYVAGGGRGMGMLARGQGELSGKQAESDGDKGDYSESNYDEFSGYGGGSMFSANTPYDEDDAEADRIYEAIDERMDSQRKRRREEQMLKDMQKDRNHRPKIADQFADLKNDLSTVTADEWDSIPEVGDHTLKYKQRKRNETYVPLPDNILSQTGGPSMGQHEQGGDTPHGPGGTSSVLGQGLAEARGTMLTMKLDKMSDSVSGQTVVDPKGYLTDLNSLKISSAAEVGDIQKARQLLGSVISSNRKHGPGWIAAAWVEEHAGKSVAARKVIMEGCEACPESEDVWIEAARLHPPENAKRILATAVHHLPNSVKIWLKAADLETSDASKKVVLRRALEFIPNSVKLWKTAIELEDVADARIMLARAVECVPQSVDMWLALARLETYENARKVLNQAREAIPTEPAIWVTASKLEEAHGCSQEITDRIMQKTISSLQQYQVVMDREYWLREAEECEHADAPKTCRSIVNASIGLGVDMEDRRRTWLDDAEACLSHAPPLGVETARSIYAHTLSVFPGKKGIWMAASQLEKSHGTPDSLEKMLKDAVKCCPQAEVLWLMAAKEKWLANDVPSARAILVEAFDANPNSEQVWLAAVKLEWENNEHARARALLGKARLRSPTERVWLKSALLEDELGEFGPAVAFLEEGMVKYPTYAKFYMMAGQIYGLAPTQDLPNAVYNIAKARETYVKGLQKCPDCFALWILACRLEEQDNKTSKARATLEIARLKLPTADHIWLEAVRLERRHGNDKLAVNLMARAIQTCPLSGLLWAEEILTCPKPQQKSKSVDALKKCDNDPYVINAVARLFEKDRKYPKARKWFNRSVTLSPDIGDCWAYYYAFEVRQMTTLASAATATTTPSDGSAEEVVNRCVAADPRHGELWTGVSKSRAYRRAATAVVLRKVAEKILLEGSPADAGAAPVVDMETDDGL